MATTSKPAAQRQEWIGGKRLRCRLKEIMDRNKVSQRKLWIDTGLSSTTIKALYHDSQQRFDGDTLIVLMTYFDVPIEDLFEVVVTPDAA